MQVTGTVTVPTANTGTSLFTLLRTATKIPQGDPSTFGGRVAAIKLKVAVADVTNRVHVVDKPGPVTLATDSGWSFSNIPADLIRTFELDPAPGNHISLQDFYLAPNANNVPVEVWALVY